MSQIIFFYIIGSPIKHILHDYQPVYYDQLTLKQQHERMRRSLINTMDFEFGTINRYVFITSWKSNTHLMNKSVEQRHVIDYFFHVNFLFSYFFLRYYDVVILAPATTHVLRSYAILHLLLLFIISPGEKEKIAYLIYTSIH